MVSRSAIKRPVGLVVDGPVVAPGDAFHAAPVAALQDFPQRQFALAAGDGVKCPSASNFLG